MTSDQTFTVTPGEEATNPVSIDGGTAAQESQGARTYSVSGLDDDVTYDIALFDADDVTVDANDNVTFADDTTEDEADQDTLAFIDRVNGATVTAASGDDEVSVAPVNGTITFRVNSYDAVSVIPAIWVDEDGAAFTDDALDLDDGEPTEAFGIGGQKNWLPSEGADAQNYSGIVELVDKDEDFYTLDTTGTPDGVADVLINYGDADTYNYANELASAAQFEDALSVDDQVVVTGYNADDLGTPTDHDLIEDVPGTPENLTANVVEQNDDTVDVEMDWDAPNPADGRIAGYVLVAVAADADDDTATSCANITAADFDGVTLDPDDPGTWDDDLATVGYATTARSEGTATEGTIEEAPAGVFCAQAMTVSETGNLSDLSNTVTADTRGAQDTTAPTIEEAELTDDTGLQGISNAGDVWTLTFSEGMAATTTSDGQFVIADGDDETDNWTLDCGTGTTVTSCVLSDEDAVDGNETLTITLGAGAEAQSYPFTIVTTNDQVTDVATNVVSIANSADVVID